MTSEKFEGYIVKVNKMIDKMTVEDRKYFIHLEEDDLHRLHHGFGTHIRNELGLWEEPPHTPNIIDGVDYSEDHPDAISMTIIKEVWKKGYGA